MSNAKKTGKHIATLTTGDRCEEMLEAWNFAHPGRDLVAQGDALFCRGSKQDREFASGFVSGWRQAICLAREDEKGHRGLFVVE